MNSRNVIVGAFEFAPLRRNPLARKPRGCGNVRQLKPSRRIVKLTPTGLMFLKKVYPPSEVFGQMSKGEARRLRKSLREIGATQFAAAPRIPNDRFNFHTAVR